MTGQLELFNTLTMVFLIGGILCAGVALFIFMRSGIREYFVLRYHDVNKDLEKETNGIQNNYICRRTDNIGIGNNAEY